MIVDPSRQTANDWDRHVDFLVFGSGAAGLSAALFGEIAGLKTLTCEKSGQVGGTTATSGGIVWAPNSEHARHAKVQDDAEAARTYLQRFTSSNRTDLTDAFLEAIPTAVSVLEKESSVRFGLVPWPDYYPDAPGGAKTGRTLEAKRFDGRRLGLDFSMVRAPLKPLMLLGGLQIDKRKLDDVLNPFRSPRTFARVLRTFGRYAIDRLKYPRGTDLGAGNALVAALVHSLLDRKARISTNTGLVDLVVENGAVVGAVVEMNGQTERIRASHGVVLATGGFAHSKKLKAELASAFPHDFSFAFKGNVGDGILAARKIGAALDRDVVSPAFWQPGSSTLLPDGSREGVLYGYLDRGRPGVIAVDKSGQRFVNEANSYHHIGAAMFAAGYAEGNQFHFICDRTFVWHHGLGMIRPFRLSLARFIRSGYITTAPTLAELADKIGVDADGLIATVNRHNEFARNGKDEDFGKGSNEYNRQFGHARAKPNPNLAPIVTKPFISLRIVPASLGTAAGLKTTKNGQVMNGDDKPIEGLYACGNDMASVMRGNYPAGGITLGPAIAFAYRVAQHAAKERAVSCNEAK